MNIVFLIGAERSGTTLVSKILNQHSEIASWIEPYFIWEKFISKKKDDFMDEKFINNKITNYIKKEFNLFLDKSKKKILLEKSPENCFRIRFLLKLFPNAKFIYLYRDGRDVAISASKKIKERREISVRKILKNNKILIEIFKEQPFIRNKFQEISFEITNHLKKNSFNFLQKSKWLNYNLWGVQYPGWQKDMHLSDLEFASKQWDKAVTFFETDKNIIDYNNLVYLKYENLLLNKKNEIENIFNFLKVKNEDINLKNIIENNFFNWKNCSISDLKIIENIQKKNLKLYGYLNER